MAERAKRVLAWMSRNERKLGAAFFFFGFITDLLAFTLLSVDVVNLAFLGYLTLGIACAVGSHLFATRAEKGPLYRRALSVLFPLGAQYAIGGVLSGCLIFYTKSSVVDVSWPFLILLLLVYAGNEYFRKYKEHLIFQSILLFFAIYAYAIFALPLAVHTLGPLVFLGSSALSVVVFSVLMLVLWRIDRKRVAASVRPIALGSAVVLTAVNAAYFTGTIPPIPLTLPEAGIYHDVSRVPGGYVLTGEEQPAWWEVWPMTVHHVPGTPLYAFSSIFAPVEFSTSIAHVWQRYDEGQRRWVTESRIIFPISGGRQGGYRGYSEKDNPAAGKWRVSIETVGGQVIGRRYFTVVPVPATPQLLQDFR